MHTLVIYAMKISARLLLDSVGHGGAQLLKFATDGVAHYVKFQLLACSGYPYEPRGSKFESCRARHKKQWVTNKRVAHFLLKTEVCPNICPNKCRHCYTLFRVFCPSAQTSHYWGIRKAPRGLAPLLLQHRD